MSCTRHRKPRLLTHTVIGGVISGVARTLLDWFLHHLTH
jgi:hypothetical protein